MADTLIQRAARERHRRLVGGLASDLHETRLDRGVSQRQLASAAGLDHATVSRIEAGLLEPSLETLSALATALGVEPSLRLFPATGPRIHDRLSAPITDALLGAAHDRWRPRLEVAVTRPARGVIDVVLSEQQDVVATEVHSQLRRLEQQARRAGEKADSLPSAIGWPWTTGPPRIGRLLVLRSTSETRALVRALPELFRAAYPAAESDAWAALTQDRIPWPGHAILWAEVASGRARILDGPPRDASR